MKNNHATTSAHTVQDRTFAWGVHALTASGAVFGILALFEMMEGGWRMAFIWMCATIFIDSIDGSLARHFRVKEVLPQLDGALLDNMVDYFTYVLVPAIALYQAQIVPPALLTATITLITLSSGYQFSQSDAKTEDHYFLGFPSYWNVLFIYLFILGWPTWVNFVVLATCAVLVFVPIKYLYPSRTVAFRRVTVVLSGLWGVAFLSIVALYPTAPNWLVYASLLYLLYYVAMSLYVTRGRD